MIINANSNSTNGFYFALFVNDKLYEKYRIQDKTPYTALRKNYYM